MCILYLLLVCCELKSNLVVSTTFLAYKINSNCKVYIILPQKQTTKQKILPSFSLSLFISVENINTSSVWELFEPLYSLICCNHLVKILCKKLLFARMWPSECEICEMHAMCLNLDNFGHCERRLLFNTHDLWNSFSVCFFCLHTLFFGHPFHSCRRLKKQSVWEERKDYESYSGFWCDMSFTFNFQAQINTSYSFYSLCIMKCFTALEVGFILSDFYEPTAQSTSSLRFNCGIKTWIPLFFQERSLYSSCLVHKELAQKLY